MKPNRNAGLAGLLGAFLFIGTAQTQDVQKQETSVNQLKENVFKAKAQLRELEEATLRGKITGSKGIVNFDNQAEGVFAFSNAEFFMDDKLIYKVVADGKKVVEKLRVFDQELAAGDHKLRIKVQYKGSDKSLTNLFKYFQDYKFDLEATENIPVEYGKTAIAQITVIDKGYFKSDIKERLSLNIKVLQEWGVVLPE